jgi:exosortase/archaeosortase
MLINRMFNYTEYIDYRALVAFLVRYYVFVVFFGLSAIAYWLPDYKNSHLSILGMLIFLLMIYLVIRDRDIHDIESKEVKSQLTGMTGN